MKFSKKRTIQNRDSKSLNRFGKSQKKEKLPNDCRFAMGYHACFEALNVNSSSIVEVWINNENKSGKVEITQLLALAKTHQISVIDKPLKDFDRLGSGHQGVVVVLKNHPEMDWNNLYQSEKKRSIVLALDGLEDPHNLGAILRTSWLMGVDGILATTNRSVKLSPSVHKVACGGVEHVPVEFFNQLEPPLNDLKKKGFWVFGLDAHGEQSLFDLEIPKKVVWVIGGEDKGLRKATQKACDQKIFIPQLSSQASYNASVASAIVIAESFRQNLK